MKIGIITIHNSPSFGGSLQSFALWKYLTDEGYDCEIIDLYRACHKGFVNSHIHVPCRFQDEGILRKIKNHIKCIIGKNITVKLCKDAEIRFDEFNQSIKYSRAYKGVDELYSCPPEYDVYISGSDQLWNPAQPYCIEPYLLTFIPQSKKKISFATSIGITELRKSEIDLFRKALNEFYAISVREHEAKKMLGQFIDKPISQVADPTFLLTQDVWKNISVNPKITDKYILLFTLGLDLELLEYVIGLSKQSGMKMFFLNQLNVESTNDYQVINNAGPREWIGYIANAELVITDSFHGTVFSIISGSNNFFARIANGNQRGSRITELLHTFNLDGHLLKSDLSQSFSELINKTVNHSVVNKIINQERERSIKFLTDNLQ